MTVFLELHPENDNVILRIRRQLQVLRDADVLEFLGRGWYLEGLFFRTVSLVPGNPTQDTFH